MYDTWVNRWMDGLMDVYACGGRIIGRMLRGWMGGYICVLWVDGWTYDMIPCKWVDG